MRSRNARLSRRQALTLFSGGAAMLAATRPLRAAPSAPVALARCRTYEEAQIVATLDRMFDQIGGLGGIVKNKTVAIKINLTGGPDVRVGHKAIELTTWTHPAVIGATLHLMDRAGARRVRLLESPWSTDEPLDGFILKAGWEPRDFTGAAKRVEFENTNYLGSGSQYRRFPVPGGGLLFPAYDLNHSYEDCDVFVSIGKLKEHRTAGITLSMKNCFGITPCTIYGEGSGIDGPSPAPQGGRGTTIHFGARAPSLTAPQEIDPDSPRDGGYRVPRCVADLAAARPIHLAIVDGISSQAGQETVGRYALPVDPGVLLAGVNPVCTDAVGAAVMGFDPMADRGTTPFEYCDSTLRLAEDLGVGTRDLNQIEVAGTQISEVAFSFREEWKKRGLPPPQPRRTRNQRSHIFHNSASGSQQKA